MSLNDEERQFWNDWNKRIREESPLDHASRRRCETVLSMLGSLTLENPRILEVGCGTGWLAERLTHFGTVFATDLADEVITRAQRRVKTVTFAAGDIMSVPLPHGTFDVVVTLETLSHVADQRAFVGRLADLLRVGGYLILTTQNRFVFERRDDVVPRSPGQRRSWVDQRGLKRLLKPRFTILSATTLEPAGHRGVLRLVNSVKLNALLGRLLSTNTIERLKERAGLGQSLVVLCRRRG